MLRKAFCPTLATFLELTYHSLFMDIASLLRGVNRPLLGVDISSSSVKIVEVSGSVSDITLTGYAIEPLDKGIVEEGTITDVSKVSEALRRCHKRLRSGTKRCALALPSSNVIKKTVQIQSNLNEQDLEAQIESEANQYIPFSLDEVSLDYQLIGPSGKEGMNDYLIAAARRERVEERVAAAEGAGLVPIIMDDEGIALQAALSYVSDDVPETATVVMVSLGAQKMQFLFIESGNIVNSREHTFGGWLLTQEMMRIYGWTSEQSERAKRQRQFPPNFDQEILKPFLNKLSLEVSRGLQYYRAASRKDKIDLIMLAGGASATPGVAEIIPQKTNIKTIFANPFANIPTSNVIKRELLVEDAPSLLLALGLAMRRFEEEQ